MCSPVTAATHADLYVVAGVMAEDRCVAARAVATDEFDVMTSTDTVTRRRVGHVAEMDGVGKIEIKLTNNSST